MHEERERGFDWRVYADATCAGLTALIPIPLVDLAFEMTFRRRIPSTIARARGVQLDDKDRAKLGRGEDGCLTLGGCLALPIAGGRYLARRLWRKVVYVLAVADAASLVSEYWQRAYLMDHMIRSGHLDEGADSDWAIEVYRKVLREADPSPLIWLARRVVVASSQILRKLSLARRRGSAAETEGLAEIVQSHWEAAQRSLEVVAILYNELYVQRPDDRIQSATEPTGNRGAPRSDDPVDPPQAVG